MKPDSTEQCLMRILLTFPTTSKSHWKRCYKHVVGTITIRVFEHKRSDKMCTVVYDSKDHSIVVTEGVLFEDKDPIADRLIKATNKVVHCGDYCFLYYNPVTKDAWLSLGDGDGAEPYTLAADIVDLLLEAGAKTVHVEAEADPDEPGYVLLKQAKGIVKDMEDD